MFNRADKIINNMREKKQAKEDAEAEDAGLSPGGGGIEVEGLKNDDADSDNDEGSD